MSHGDDTTPKYGAGFRAAVKQLQAPHPGGWAATYTDEAAWEQALQRAYQAGYLAGVSAGMGPVTAPGPVEVDEEPVIEPVVESFDTPENPPERLTVTLPPLGDDDPLVWAVRHARAHLSLSLVEGTEFVRSILEEQ